MAKVHSSANGTKNNGKNANNNNNNSNKIGVFEGIAYCIGDIVGSGIFISPASILRHTGSIGLSLCVWVVGAIIAACGALVYVELGTTIRKSGGDFAYLSHARWYPLATAFLWVSTTLTFPTIMAIQTLTFGEYMFEGLNSFFPISPEYKNWLKRLIGYMAIWLICFINLFSLNKIAARFQVVLTVVKLLIIMLIILTGLYQIIINGHTEAFHGMFNGTRAEPGDFVLGLYASLLAYNGWDILNFATEEIVNPRLVLPIAALCGIGISAAVYLLINIAYFSVISYEEFIQTEAVAVRFAQKTLPGFSHAVPFLIALLLLGNLNSSIFASSRYVFAGAKNGIMPPVLSAAHEDSMSPRVAVLYELFVLIVLSFIGDLDHLIGYMSYSLWMQKSCTVIALLYMRYQDFAFRKDAVRTPIILPIVCLCTFIAMLVISANKDPLIIVYAVSMLAIGLILYYIFIYPKRATRCCERLNESSVMLAQIVLNASPAVKED